MMHARKAPVRGGWQGRKVPGTQVLTTHLRLASCHESTGHLAALGEITFVAKAAKKLQKYGQTRHEGIADEHNVDPGDRHRDG
jgi:hypothetical protein